MASKAIDEKDANHDQALSVDELGGWPGMKSAFKAIDRNGDSKIDREELERNIAEYAKGNIGPQSLTCFVNSSGRPASDAIVEFTPEPLFAEYCKPVHGTTGFDGSSALLPLEHGMPGVMPGMYRVTISKKVGDRETVPKKSNTESESGFDVSDALGGAPARFNI